MRPITAQLIALREILGFGTEKRSPTNALSLGDGTEILGRPKQWGYRAPEGRKVWSERPRKVCRVLLNYSAEYRLAQVSGKTAWRQEKNHPKILLRTVPRARGGPRRCPLPRTHWKSRLMGHQVSAWEDRGSEWGILSARQGTATDELVTCKSWKGPIFVRNLTPSKRNTQNIYRNAECFTVCNVRHTKTQGNVTVTGAYTCH